MKLTNGLEKKLEVGCHSRSGHSLPCLFNDDGLTSFLQSHLLKEDVHNYHDNDREKNVIVLNLIHLEDNKLLVKECFIGIVVQRLLQLATLVKAAQNSREVLDAEVNVLITADLRDALQGKLIEGIERE